MEKPIEPNDYAAIGFSETSDPLFSDKIFVKTEGEKFVVFFLNDKLYAVATREVAEVTQTLPVAPLPNAPEWVFGIANLRGEIVTVLNLPKILHEEIGGISNKAKFVILQSKNFDSLIAFTVERLGEIITLPSEKIEFVEEEANPHVFAKAVHTLGVLHLVSAENILDALAF